jgi:hypothetical protein
MYVIWLISNLGMVIDGSQSSCGGRAHKSITNEYSESGRQKGCSCLGGNLANGVVAPEEQWLTKHNIAIMCGAMISWKSTR